MKTVTTIQDQIMGYEVLAPISGVVDQTIVLLHGALSNSNSTRALAEGFIKEIPNTAVLHLDLPGHGSSIGKPAETAERIAEIVTGLIDRLLSKGEIVAPFILVGQSMGGTIANTLYLSGLRNVKAIYTISTAPQWKDLAQAMSQVPAGTFRDLARQMMVDDFAINTTPEQQADFAQNLLPQLIASKEACVADAKVLAKFDITDRLNEFDVPVLLVSGDIDTSATLDSAKQLLTGIKNATLIEYPGGSHTLLFKETDRLVNDLAQFLEENL